MMDLIGFIMEFIRIDIFNGYALFSILFIIASFFIKNEYFLKNANDTSNSILKFAGIFHFMGFILLLSINLASAQTEEELYCISTRMFGTYWFAYWLHALSPTLITQLLWNKKVRNSKIWRAVIGVLLIMPLEKFVIILTSFHRDYLPSSWTMTYNSFLFNIYDSIENFIPFSFYCWIYYMISEQIKTRLIKNRNVPWTKYFGTK